MIPAVDPSISDANPKFEALYRDLCTTKLNANGSSKLDARAQKEHEAVVEELHKARVVAAREDLIKSSLCSLAYRGSELPSELQVLIAIVTAALENPLTGEDADLLKDDIHKFTENIPVIAPVLSRAFEDDLTTLTNIAAAAAPSADRPDATALLAWIHATHARTASHASALHRRRLQLADDVGRAHAAYRAVLETCVRALEQTVHGAVARGTRARADYLATVAEGMAKKLQLQHHQLVAATASPEMEQALIAKARELERDDAVLRRRVREAEERLEDYRRAGAMDGMAREYAEILRETARVEGDVARLERGR